MQEIGSKALNFDRIEINRRKLHAYNQPNYLNLVNVDKTVMSTKVNHGDKSFLNFIGYIDDDAAKPLVMLPQQVVIKNVLIKVAKICHL